MDFMELWKGHTRRVDDALAGYLDGDIPARLREAMRYSVFAGGKRLRPALLLASCELFGGTAELAMPLACAMEMIHTYSLIHDDLPAMDNDDYRRGRPTNHKVFGEGMAVLAGDGLLSFAFEVMLAGAFRPGVDREAYTRAVLCIAEAAGARGMVAGQAIDLENEGNAGLTAEQLFDIHRRKTGAMIAASAVAGALVNGPDTAQIEAVHSYGRNLGIAFQIEDDILDVVGSAQALGKTPGKDAKSDKSTYVKLFGLEGSREKAAYHTNAAVEALGMFGGKAFFLTEMARYMLGRDR